MKITDYHAKYYAYELTRRRRGGDIDRISSSLFDAAVDLNPHQIDAALFALQNPLTKGVLLADEVGLGKTIEAALVLCQYWAERRRRLIVICPAALRKQWSNELSDKFHVPTQVLDSRTFQQLRKEGVYNPLDQDVISIMSFNFAASLEEKLILIPWDLVVIDEAHKLRNAHRDSHKTGQALKRALRGSRKLLLTATPLQNSLMELYGLSTVIDEQLFGDAVSFRSQFMRDGNNIAGLKNRLREFSKRTLRRQVLEYVKYTERKPITIPFSPGEKEQQLYDLVSGYLQREDAYGVPRRQRHLIALIVRKLLASSTAAVVKTLTSIITRLKDLEQQKQEADKWFEQLIDDEDLDDEWLEDAENVEPIKDDIPVDPVRLRGEIAELEQYLELAQRIHSDEKSKALTQALSIGFDRMAAMSAPRKAVIFTESRRTQDYLERYLQQHGFGGKVVTFSGNSNSAETTGIYQRWLDKNKGSDRIAGSPAVDRRSALIDYFRDHSEILIATEAAAEGVNLQFCNLVINYDLPWNPQRIEQRIGRCHRYGQKFDVVVINFVNQRNEADRRVLELLSEKFHLFDGLFGASDELIGRIESGVDFEKRIAAIYDTCRTSEAIQEAFAQLQKELEDSINQRMKETEAKLLENFDEQIHELLRIQREKAVEQLDRVQKLFWWLTKFVLSSKAAFHDHSLSFTMDALNEVRAPSGKYHLIQKGQDVPENAHTYRLTHPLGEYVLDTGRRINTPVTELIFKLSEHPAKVSVLEGLQSKSGWLELNLLELESFQHEEHLVFSAQTDADEVLDYEACVRLFNISADQRPCETQVPEDFSQLAKRQIDAALSKALDENDQYFQREREKLDKWAEDQVMSAEMQLEDTKIKIREAKKQARTAQTLEEQKTAQESIQQLERQQRRQRQSIFDVEDEIESKRDLLIDALEKQMHKTSTTHRLFTIRWRLV